MISRLREWRKKNFFLDVSEFTPTLNILQKKTLKKAPFDLN